MPRRYPVHTITDDNGSEFALDQLIERNINAPVYFARPGHPEERRTCENTIGLIREFFPKRTTLLRMSRIGPDSAVARLGAKFLEFFRNPVIFED